MTSYVNETFKLAALPVPSDSDERNATWTSSNPNVATVTYLTTFNKRTGKEISGYATVTIKSAGSTVITAKIGNAKAECTINAETKASSDIQFTIMEPIYSGSGNKNSKGTYFATYYDAKYAMNELELGKDYEVVSFDAHGKIVHYIAPKGDIGKIISFDTYDTIEDATKASSIGKYVVITNSRGEVIGYGSAQNSTGSNSSSWAGAYTGSFSSEVEDKITASAKAAADAKRTELESDKDKINSFKENYEKNNDDYSNEIAKKKTLEKMEEAGYKVDDIQVYYNKDHAIDIISYTTKDGKEYALNDDLKNYYIEEYNKIMATIRNEDGADGYKLSKEYQKEIESKVGEEYVSSAAQEASKFATGGKLTLTPITQNKPDESPDESKETSSALEYYKDNGYTKENADIVSSAIKAEGDTYQNIIHSSSSTQAQKDAAKDAYAKWYKEYMT